MIGKTTWPNKAFPKPRAQKRFKCKIGFHSWEYNNEHTKRQCQFCDRSEYHYTGDGMDLWEGMDPALFTDDLSPVMKLRIENAGLQGKIDRLEVELANTSMELGKAHAIMLRHVPPRIHHQATAEREKSGPEQNAIKFPSDLPALEPLLFSLAIPYDAIPFAAIKAIFDHHVDFASDDELAPNFEQVAAFLDKYMKKVSPTNEGVQNHG